MKGKKEESVEVSVMVTKKLNSFTKLLGCKLTDAELLNYGNELASIIQDIQTEEDRQVNVKQELKSRLTALESGRSEVASKIARREELRDVSVESMLDFKKGVYREIRTDTGEVIHERPIRDEERQESLI